MDSSSTSLFVLRAQPVRAGGRARFRSEVDVADVETSSPSGAGEDNSVEVPHAG